MIKITIIADAFYSPLGFNLYTLRISSIQKTTMKKILEDQEMDKISQDLRFVMKCFREETR